MIHPQQPGSLTVKNLNSWKLLTLATHEINLSGIYFPGTGLVYQFPYNSTLAPDTSIYLAANSSTFISKYGFEPFGQFTRHISNDGQNIVLSDAFGNVIDNVQFSDTLPWPEADGNGYYLKLKDASLDNNIPANWIASNDTRYYPPVI